MPEKVIEDLNCGQTSFGTSLMHVNVPCFSSFNKARCWKMRCFVSMLSNFICVSNEALAKHHDLDAHHCWCQEQEHSSPQHLDATFRPRLPITAVVQSKCRLVAMTKPGTTSATSAILPVGPLIFCPWCAYTNHAELKQVVSGTPKTTGRVPGSNAHHPCTNCSCSQPGCWAQLFRSSRQFASKYLEAFKASRRILQSRLIPKVLAKTAKFRDDLNMAKKKNPVKSKLVVFTVQTVCKCSRYISKKQEKNTQTQHRFGSQVHTLGQNHSQFL